MITTGGRRDRSRYRQRPSIRCSKKRIGLWDFRMLSIKDRYPTMQSRAGGVAKGTYLSLSGSPGPVRTLERYSAVAARLPPPACNLVELMPRLQEQVSAADDGVGGSLKLRFSQPSALPWELLRRLLLQLPPQRILDVFQHAVWAASSAALGVGRGGQ